MTANLTQSGSQLIAGPFRFLAYALGLTIFVYAAVYVDLIVRARSAYLEGETRMAWHKDPALKRAHYEAEFQMEKALLYKEKAKGLMTDPEHRQRLSLAEFAREEHIADSSLKMATHWFQTACELFQPPKSRWVRLSCERAAEAKTLWKAELVQAKVPFQEYMLE